MIKTKTIEIKFNRDFRKYKKGIHRVLANAKGQPKERFLRDLLEDAKTDNCCEIVKKEKLIAKKDIKNG